MEEPMKGKKEKKKNTSEKTPSGEDSPVKIEFHQMEQPMKVTKPPLLVVSATRSRSPLDSTMLEERHDSKRMKICSASSLNLLKSGEFPKVENA